jgi:hypothetical protein
MRRRKARDLFLCNSSLDSSTKIHSYIDNPCSLDLHSSFQIGIEERAIQLFMKLLEDPSAKSCPANNEKLMLAQLEVSLLKVQKLGVKNPVIVVDEIDKVGSSDFYSKVYYSLLQLLNIEENHRLQTTTLKSHLITQMSFSF